MIFFRKCFLSNILFIVYIYINVYIVWVFSITKNNNLFILIKTILFRIYPFLSRQLLFIFILLCNFRFYNIFVLQSCDWPLLPLHEWSLRWARSLSYSSKKASSGELECQLYFHIGCPIKSTILLHTALPDCTKCKIFRL